VRLGRSLALPLNENPKHESANKPMRNFFSILAIFAAIPLYADTTPEQANSLDPLVQPYIDSQIVDAISIGVVQGDKQWTRHYGQLSKSQEKKPDDSTIYEIGSISKVFTGILLADAVSTDRVRLDQSIGELLPVLQTNNKELGETILLRHLTTHVSGLPRMPINFQPADPANPYADYDRDRMIDFLSAIKPRRKPGEKSQYSNLAVGLLGELLSIEAKLSYEELLKKNLTGPLKMVQTSLSLSPEQRSHLAPPHDADRTIVKNWDLNAFAGAGGIRSNTTDMLRFIKAQLHPSDDRIGKAIELAWQEHLPSLKGAFAMGLGWHIARDGNTRWHNGQTGGYHSMMLIDRRSDTGVILLCNTATGEVDALAKSILRLLEGGEVKPREFPKFVTVDETTVARLAGKYKVAPSFVLTVRSDGEKLYVQATGQPEFRIYPESKVKWHLRVVDAQLVFELPEEGPCTKVTLHQNGQEMPGPRMEK